jgi:hypothetical protein
MVSPNTLSRFALPLSALLALPAFALLQGCAEGTWLEPTDEAGFAGVRIVQASADAPLLNLYLDGEPLDEWPLDVGESWPGVDRGSYGGVAAGVHEIALVPRGGELHDALLAKTFRFAADEHYTLYSYGAVYGDGEPVLGLRSLRDAPCDALGACARLIHAATDVGPVSLWVFDGPLYGWREVFDVVPPGLPADSTFPLDATHTLLGVGDIGAQWPRVGFGVTPLPDAYDLFLVGEPGALRLLSVHGAQCALVAPTASPWLPELPGLRPALRPE